MDLGAISLLAEGTLTSPGGLLDSGDPTLQVFLTLGIILLYVLVRRLIVVWTRRYEQTTKRYRVQKWAVAIATLLIVGYLVFLWLPKGDQFWQFLALVSAGLAIALTGPITNLAGWFFIVLRKPFSVKDRVQIGDSIAGDVIDISMFQFSLIEIGNWVDAEQSTGRIVHVPNGILFTQHLANYTQGFSYIWNEIPVTITFESNWEQAHQLLTDLIEKFTVDVEAEARKQMREASSRFMVHYTRLTPIVWVTVADIGVTLTLRYLCEARRRRASEALLWMEILRAVAMENDIDFAYPTTRFYDNRREGKPGAGGPAETHEMEPSMAIPELGEMTMSIGNLQEVYQANKAEVVLPGDESSESVDLDDPDDPETIHPIKGDSPAQE